MEGIKEELYDLPDTHQILIQVTARDLKRVIHNAVIKAIQNGYQTGMRYKMTKEIESKIIKQIKDEFAK